MNPRWPIYIVSKGRWESRLTVRALNAMGVPFRIIVEEQEREAYAAVVDPPAILVLDPEYQRQYVACCELADGASRGSGPARNFAWDHAAASGADWHWTVDDNIRGFYRLHRNLKTPVGDGTILRCIEDFTERYMNVAMAGPNYFMFASRKSAAIKPFTLNTRIFSCNLIKTSAPFRWEARYNEDLHLSLRMLKAGLCTILFNAFLQYKMPTMTMKGGNTDTIYRDGTLDKSRMIAELHPDVARVVKRFGRIHHLVDYKPFAKNRLVRRDDLDIPEGSDNYGMALRQGFAGEPWSQ
jgi:hypothetical protein